MSAPSGARTHVHRHVIWPSLGSGLVARIGDWTWQAVARETGCDVLTARTEDGRPAYLSFHYYRIRAGREFHLGSLEFGDRLTVGTQVLRSGSQSTLTLHRLVRRPALEPGDIDDVDVSVDAATFWGAPGDRELRAEHLNRWISHAGSSNSEIAAASPVGFALGRLPQAPEEAPPRHRVMTARRTGSFREAELSVDGPVCTLRYRVDPARDLNSAGLLYFAAYFHIVDWALGQAWSFWGRDVPSFLARRVRDVQVLYQGNADAGTVLDIEVSRWRADECPDEVVDVRLTRAGQLVAIATQRLAPHGRDAAAESVDVTAGDGQAPPQNEEARE